MNRFVALALAVCVSAAYGQTSKTLEELNREEEFRRAAAAIDDLDAKFTVLIKQREADCEKAVGYRPFCGCLMKELPIAWTFADYVAITTRSKVDNGYAAMKKDLQQAYDKVGPIRNACVKAINSGK